MNNRKSTTALHSLPSHLLKHPCFLTDIIFSLLLGKVKNIFISKRAKSI